MKQIGNISNSDSSAEANNQPERDSSQLLPLNANAESGSASEKRISNRYPIWWTLQFTPVDEAGGLLLNESDTVVGKDISVSGLSFSHQYPLQFRRAIISFARPEFGELSIEVEITWTRSTAIGLYESGCRFIRKIEQVARLQA
jgi:hypothetical protein